MVAKESAPSSRATPKARPSQQRAAETYERILAAAAEVLCQVGIERLSTNLVCDCAGLTPPALYRYFPNKYALLEELGRRLLEKQNAQIDGRINAELLAGPLERVEDVLTGLLLDTYRVTAETAGGMWILKALRAVPSLAWVPLLILWMQIGEESKVTLIAIGAFFPVFTTVYAALRHVDPHLVEAGRAFGYHGLSLLRTVQLPAVVPAVFSGLRLALAQAWLFLVAAELIASSMGLGFLLTDSQNNGRTDRLILAIILLAVLGKLTDWLLGLLERRALRRWA